MAAINTIAKEWADELRDGIAWLIVWKTGRSWNAQAVWLGVDNDTFEPEDLEAARNILQQDPNAVMLNGYYCGHLGEDMTVTELAAGIRWHYENGYNLLSESVAFPPEPMEQPEELLAAPVQRKPIHTEERNQQQEQNDYAVTEYLDINEPYLNRQGSKLPYQHLLPPRLYSDVRGPPIIKNQRKSKSFQTNQNDSKEIQVIPRKFETQGRKAVNIWTD